MNLIENATIEKLSGRVYTPSDIAQFILKWAQNGNKNYDVLEPSCGDGIFLKEIKKNNFEYKSIVAVEIEKSEATKARDIKLQNSTILVQDFFSYCNSTNDKFDLIIGNPPFIRYQFFKKDQRDEAEKIFKTAGLKYSKLTNAWVSFIVGSCLLLKDEGKMGFVVPAEILQVTFAKQLRIYLAHFFNKITIVSFKELVFPDIQQEVVLLLCEKNNTSLHNIDHVEVIGTEDLPGIDIRMLKTPSKRIDFKSNKWTFYFLDQKEIDFIENLLDTKEILSLGTYAKVEVGITTGSNPFFTVPFSTVEKYNLYKYAYPMVGRSVHVPSIVYNEQDWKANIEAGVRSFFLNFPKKIDLQNSPKALEYILEGENAGINKGFKCGLRDEWQIVPSSWVSDALFIRRNNIFPKLIINQVGAYTTDTMHRVTINKDGNLNGKKIDSKAFIASYYNSLSLAFAEICGRSHGGGALELMPNEVENILIPYNKNNAEIFEQIEKVFRQKKKNIEEILKFSNNFILKDGYGFSDSEIQLADRIWKKLLKRRLGRKHH